MKRNRARSARILTLALAIALGVCVYPAEAFALWGLTTRASVGPSGLQGNGKSAGSAISTDGRYVAFSSVATNLVTGDTNGTSDIFVRDRVLNTTTRVSVDSAGAQCNGDSFAPCISTDGRCVAFYSVATNLVAGDTNARSDVFVRDRVTGTTTRVSVDSAGVQANDAGFAPCISADGRYVGFDSMATNLVTGDTNGALDVFVRDRVLNTTTRMSVDSAGVQGDGHSYGSSISADGRRVAFESLAAHLVTGDTNAAADDFVHDRATGATTRESVGPAGAQSNAGCYGPSISADGRYVVFESAAALVAGDTNLVSDIFVHEAPTMATSITIKTNATTARIGNIPILSGAVTPFGMVGKNIVAYVKKPGKTYWTYSSNRTVYNLGGNAAWQYKYYFKPGMVKGYYVFKAVVPAWPGFLTSTSPTTVSIRLR